MSSPMTMFKLETMIYASEDGTNSVFTLNPALQKQLDALTAQHPEVCQRKTRGETGLDAEKINTRKQYGSETNSIARRGQGGDPPLRSPEAAPLVGFGAMPQPFLGRSTPRKPPTRRRQRSVPASNTISR